MRWVDCCIESCQQPQTTGNGIQQAADFLSRAVTELSPIVKSKQWIMDLRNFWSWKSHRKSTLRKRAHRAMHHVVIKQRVFLLRHWLTKCYLDIISVLLVLLWANVNGADGLTDGRPSSSSVSCYLNCFFSVRLNLILVKLRTNDMTARGYKVSEQILNMCINYVYYVKGAHKNTAERLYFCLTTSCLDHLGLLTHRDDWFQSTNSVSLTSSFLLV